MLNSEMAWVVIYSGLVAMRKHPGYAREGTEVPSLEQLACLTDAAMSHYHRRFPSCLGSPSALRQSEQ